MKRFAWGLLIVVGMALSNLACDDEKEKSGADAGGDASVTGQCKGTFASLTRTQLERGTSPAGKCASAADLNVICSNDVRAIAGSCGGTCLASGMASSDCINTCVVGQLDPDLGADCSSCYSAVVACTLEKCQNQCTGNSSSPACVECQAKPCLEPFFQCSGLPSGRPPADAGAADATAG